MRDCLPKQEQELIAWAEKFLLVASMNLDALGLTAADLEPLASACENLKASNFALYRLNAQMRAAVCAKNCSRKALTASVRRLVKTIQATRGASDELKTDLRITVASTVRDKSAPVTPELVAAVPDAGGRTLVTWQRRGNKPTTLFVVFAQTLAPGERAPRDTDWTMVGGSQSTRFTHSGNRPGAPMAYRVMATRAGMNSAPSEPVTVFVR